MTGTIDGNAFHAKTVLTQTSSWHLYCILFMWIVFNIMSSSWMGCTRMTVHHQHFQLAIPFFVKVIWVAVQPYITSTGGERGWPSPPLLGCLVQSGIPVTLQLIWSHFLGRVGGAEVPAPLLWYQKSVCLLSASDQSDLCVIRCVGDPRSLHK